MTRFTVLTALILLGASMLPAGDLSGKWLGTIDVKDENTGTTISTPVKIELSQRDTAISGKIGRSEDAEVIPIKNAKVDGNTISFEASNGETMAPCKFVLTIDGDRMEGDMKTSIDTEPLTGRVKVTRTKQ